MQLHHHLRPRRQGTQKTSSWLLAEITPHQGSLVGCLALLCLSSALLALGPYLVRHAIDVDIASRDAAGLRLTVLLFLTVEISNLGLIYGQRVWLERLGQTMLATLKKRLFAHVLALPLSFHDRESPGKLLSRVQNDSQALRALFSSSAVTMVGDLLMMAIMLAVMVAVSPRLTLVTCSVLPLLALLSAFFHRRTHPLFLRMRGLTAEVTEGLTEIIGGHGVLRAYERRRWAAARFQELNEKKRDVQLRGERLFVLWFHGMTWLQTLALAAILGMGGIWTLAGLVTIGTLTMFLGYVRRLFTPVFHLSEQLAEVQRAWSAAERIRDLLEEPLPPSRRTARGPWPGLRSEVRFEHVWFRYDAEASDEHGWILRDVSFVVPAGQRFALVGPTGSGKTTLVSLLCGFYQPQRGTIRVDGVDIRTVEPASFLRHVGLVLQDVHLFAGDLESNLTLGTEVTRDALARAARLVQADRLIERLGWQADLSEHGANLSHGERQLLSFTRALVKDPPLLVLDEATSAIDPATEALVERGLAELLKGRTALIVAHRLSTIRSAHRILVLDHGRIVEEGRHDTLTSGIGLYARLHALQKEGPRAVSV